MIELLKKMVKVKAKLEAVTKSSNNPFFKSKYADLNSHLDAIEPLLSEVNLILFQPCEYKEGKNLVTSRIYDADTGHFIESSMELLYKDSDMQKLGSAVTYARRYTLSALCGMKAEDDDGNVAANKTVTTTAASNFTQKLKDLPKSPETGMSLDEALSKTTPAKDNVTTPSFRRKPAVVPAGDDL